MKELKTIYDKRKSFDRKAFIMEGKYGRYLYSYCVKVFFIPYDDKQPMRLMWEGYSLTTYRHIREFIKQFASDIQRKDSPFDITKDYIKSFYNKDTYYS